jgi:hypothetical protein
MKYLQIHVEQPCSEGWDNMKPDKNGHFCAACAKTVVDFTNMSDADILAFFKKNNGKDVCGRINPYQLENPLPMPSPAPVRYAHAFALAAGIALTNAVYAEPPQVTPFEVVSGQNIVNTPEIQEEIRDNAPNDITFNFKSIKEKCSIEITMFGVKKQVTDGQIVFGFPKTKVKNAMVTVKMVFSDTRIKTVNDKISLVLSDKNAFDVKIEAIPVLGKVVNTVVEVVDKKGVRTKQSSYVPLFRAIIVPLKS